MENERDNFVLLGVDVSELDRKTGDLAELEARLADARKQMLALRPSDKEYAKRTAELVGLSNAFDVQIQAARDDVTAEVSRLKQDALAHVGLYVDQMWQRVQDLDAKAIKALVEVYDTLIERDQASIELDKRAGILKGWNYEFQAGCGVHEPVTPWLAGWMGWHSALQVYLARFLKLIPGGKPEPGKELEWFSKRV